MHRRQNQCAPDGGWINGSRLDRCRTSFCLIARCGLSVANSIQGTQRSASFPLHARRKDHTLIRRKEVLLILRKWKEESTPLRVIAELRGVYLALDCCIIGVSYKSVGLRLPGGRDFCEFSWRGLRFDYGEETLRGLVESPPDEAGHIYSAALVGLRPSGRRLIFMQISEEH